MHFDRCSVQRGSGNQILVMSSKKILHACWHFVAVSNEKGEGSVDASVW
mgnify:FL=1